MNTSRLPVSVGCLLLLLPAVSMRAELIQADSPRYGQNAFTIDTATGLAWLDLPFSVGLSYLEVVAATQAGGSFEGFRYATALEVLTLYADAGIPGTGFYPENSAGGQSASSLISLLGATSFQLDHPQVYGISGTPANFQTRIVPGLAFVYDDLVLGYLVEGIPGESLAWGETTSSLTVGSWLVYQVPEPTSWLIGTMGFLLALVVSRICAPNAPKSSRS